jgi:hypothetical protein
MKYLLIFVIFLSCFVQKKSQTFKINKSKYIDLLYEINKNTDNESKYIFYLKNNTNITFIIDPFGFWGNTTMYENGNLIKPNKLGLKGYYERFSDKWCERDLIILKPNEYKKLNYFNTNYKDTALYNFDKDKKYFEIVKSAHNKETILYLGCEDYVKNLEARGYKVLEDSISTKIPLIP